MKKLFTITVIFILSINFGFSQHKIYTIEAETGPIGKSSTAEHPATKTITIHLPKNFEITNITPYFKYRSSKILGESYYQPQTYSAAPLIGYKNQTYKEWGFKWARAYYINTKNDATTQLVTVRFESWKDDNSREGELAVSYFIRK